MKAVRDAAILLILVVLALTVRISPVDSSELAPLKHASLADIATPAVDRDEVQPAAQGTQGELPENPLCPATSLDETQVFVFELNDAIDSLREVAPDARIETVVRRLDLDCT